MELKSHKRKNIKVRVLPQAVLAKLLNEAPIS